MAKRMPPEVLAYLKTMGKAYGKLGGKTAAKNMTAAERSARAKKASMAAAKKRTAERLARDRATKKSCCEPRQVRPQPRGDEAQLCHHQRNPHVAELNLEYGKLKGMVESATPSNVFGN